MRKKLMLSAQNSTEQTVLAWNTTKDDGPFTCPECHHAVLLKKGTIKVHHFAHVPPIACTYGVGESETHRRAKVAIYQSLLTHPQITKLQLERSLGEVRPDISFYFKTIPIAIEVQLSTLSLPQIIERTEAYHRKKVYVLWTPPLDPKIVQEDRYSPKIWEKFLHMLYFGQVLYWLADDRLQPIVYDPYRLEVPFNTWYEFGGVERAEGGYTYRSRRYRTPRLLDTISIVDLSPIVRQAWKSEKMTLPAARIWGTQAPR
jgi:competence protein CoiA